MLARSLVLAAALVSLAVGQQACNDAFVAAYGRADVQAALTAYVTANKDAAVSAAIGGGVLYEGVGDFANLCKSFGTLCDVDLKLGLNGALFNGVITVAVCFPTECAASEEKAVQAAAFVSTYIEGFVPVEYAGKVAATIQGAPRCPSNFEKTDAPSDTTGGQVATTNANEPEVTSTASQTPCNIRLFLNSVADSVLDDIDAAKLELVHQFAQKANLEVEVKFVFGSAGSKHSVECTIKSDINDIDLLGATRFAIQQLLNPNSALRANIPLLLDIAEDTVDWASQCIDQEIVRGVQNCVVSLAFDADSNTLSGSISVLRWAQKLVDSVFDLLGINLTVQNVIEAGVSSSTVQLQIWQGLQASGISLEDAIRKLVKALEDPNSDLRQSPFFEHLAAAAAQFADSCPDLVALISPSAQFITSTVALTASGAASFLL